MLETQRPFASIGSISTGSSRHLSFLGAKATSALTLKSEASLCRPASLAPSRVQLLRALPSSMYFYLYVQLPQKVWQRGWLTTREIYPFTVLEGPLLPPQGSRGYSFPSPFLSRRCCQQSLAFLVAVSSPSPLSLSRGALPVCAQVALFF